MSRPVAFVPDLGFFHTSLPLCLTHWHISGHRDRLITRSLHWINRMSSDQKSSVLCSKVKMFLIVSILFIVIVAVAALSFCTSRFLCFSWDSWYPTCFSLLKYSSCCLCATFFMSFKFTHQRCCDRRFLAIELVARFFIICFLCFR